MSRSFYSIFKRKSTFFLLLLLFLLWRQEIPLALRSSSPPPRTYCIPLWCRRARCEKCLKNDCENNETHPFSCRLYNIFIVRLSHCFGHNERAKYITSSSFPTLIGHWGCKTYNFPSVSLSTDISLTPYIRSSYCLGFFLRLSSWFGLPIGLVPWIIRFGISFGNDLILNACDREPDQCLVSLIRLLYSGFRIILVLRTMFQT